MKAAFLSISLALVLWRANGESTNSSNRITLQECLAETLAHSEQLVELRVDLERAAGSKVEIRSRELLQLSGGGQAGWRSGSLYNGNGPYALFSAQFYQPVIDRGTLASWRRGQGEVVVAEQRLNAAVSDRLHEARHEYLRLQQLEELIGIYESIDQRLDANVKSAQQRKDVGSDGPRPVLQARVQLLASRADLTGFKREEFEVRTQLAELMQRTADQLPLPADKLAHAKVSVDWAAQAQMALERRADLKLLRALIENTKDDRRLVDAGYFPYIGITGSGLYLPGKKLVYAATPIIEGQTPLGTEGRVGATLSWQIIDNGQVTGVSRQIAAIQGEYEITLQQLEQNIPRSLAQIENALEDADAKLMALEKSADESQENLKLIESRVALGEATQLDFSDAQRDLLAVQRGIAAAAFQYSEALGELDWVTGRYLEFTGLRKQP